MSNQLTPPVNCSSAIEQALIQGDLSRLTPEQRLSYYNKVCESLGLNPLTKPFEYIRLNGKEVLYATRACTEQLRTIHKVSLTITSREVMGDVYVVTAQAKTGERCDESTGAVTIKGLAGDNLANAYMKAETKAKRRVTLSICGLGLLDETEVASIPNAVISRQSEPVNHGVAAVIEIEKKYAAPPAPAFVAPEVTPAMKARFEKVENQQIKEAAQSFIPEPLPFEGSENPAPDAVYVNGNTLVFHGKHKGKTFAEIPDEELSKSIWGAEKGLSEGAEWVDKMGVQHVQQFVQQAKAWLNKRG